MTDTLRHAHASGRFDATAKQVDAYLDYLAGKAVAADVITMTEVGKRHIRRAVKAWARKRGWHVYHPRGYGRFENLILVRKPFKLSLTGTRLLTGFRLRGARKAPIFATLGTVSRKGARRRFRFAVTHTPAHVTSPDGLRPGWDSTVYRSVIRSLGRIGRRRKHNVSLVLAADWNLDLKLDWVKRFFRQAFPGLHPSWPYDGRRASNRGTHKGGRLIDFDLTDAPVVRAYVLAKRPGFDHAGVLTILSWRD